MDKNIYLESAAIIESLNELLADVEDKKATGIKKIIVNSVASKEVVNSSLTDSLTGILQGNYSMDIAKEETLKKFVEK